MNATEGLVLVLGVLCVSAGAALVLVHRALSPFRRPMQVNGSDSSDVGSVLRRASREALIALVVSATALTALIAVGAAAGGLDPATGYVLPIVAIGVGLATYACLRPRRAVSRPISTATLVRRQPWDSAPRSWFIACGVLAAVLLVLIVVAAAVSAAVSPPIATYRGWGVPAVAALVVGLLVASVCALRRIASEPALPVPLESIDRTVRGIASRLVLTLTACGLLTMIALVALQSGVWWWSSAFVFADDGATVARLTVGGMVTTFVGAAAGVGTIATSIAAVVLTVSFGGLAAEASRLPEPVAA